MVSTWTFAVLLGVIMLSACAPQPVRVTADRASMRAVELRNGSVSGKGVRYDRKAGRCTEGATQLLTRDQFDALRAGWTTPKDAEPCTGPHKKRTPATTGYPVAFAGKPGSAQVMVRIEADGRVESAHAVCATDPAFADAAVATAMAIEFSPKECGGQPRRSVILLPLNYDWK